VGCKKQTEDT